MAFGTINLIYLFLLLLLWLESRFHGTCFEETKIFSCRVLFHVHDEVILEVDKDVKCKDVDHIMSTTPEWLPGCPIGSESKEAECYEK